MKKVFTLAIVTREGEVLLARKQKKLGAGFWNGFGGKVEAGESIEAAAIRECQEEIRITPTAITLCGINRFFYPDSPLGADEHEVHIFKVSAFTGTPAATPEMAEPTWFPYDRVPYDAMWPDDRLWLPLLFAGKTFRGAFGFDIDNNIVRQELSEVVLRNA